MPRIIKIHYRIVITVSVKIKPVDIGRLYIAYVIRVDKPANGRIVIAAVQVVQACFRVVIIPAVAERIQFCYTTIIRHIFCNVNTPACIYAVIAPCVVFILRHKVLIRVVDSVNVAQQVLLVVVHVSVVLEPYHALHVVVVFEYFIPDLFRDDFRSVRIVGMRYSVYRLFLAYPVHIVQIAVASATCEQSTPRPRQRFALVARRVPQCVVAAYALRHSVFRHRGQAFILELY